MFWYAIRQSRMSDAARQDAETNSRKLRVALGAGGQESRLDLSRFESSRKANDVITKNSEAQRSGLASESGPAELTVFRMDIDLGR